MKADPKLADSIEKLVDDFKKYADTDPGEQQLQLEQRVLESRIHDLEQARDLTPKEKTGMMMDRVVDRKNLERKLKSVDTPLEFLIDVYTDRDIPIDFRIKAATTCMTYVHRKLPTAVEHIGDDMKVAHEHTMKIEFIEASGDDTVIIMGEAERLEADDEQGGSNDE